jgi:hypothetical protein
VSQQAKFQPSQQGCTHAQGLLLTLLLYLSFPKPLSASSSMLCGASPLLLLLQVVLCFQAVDSRAGATRPLGLSVCLLTSLQLLRMLLCVSLPACCNMLLKHHTRRGCYCCATANPSVQLDVCAR